MSDFWQQIIISIVEVILLGGLVTYIITKILNIEERKIKSGEDQLLLEKKKEISLNLIQKEIQEIIDSIRANEKKYHDISTLPYVRFNTSYWEVLRLGGGIPTLIDPTTLEIVTTFYFYVENTNYLYKQLLETLDNPDHPKTQFLFERFREQINSLNGVIKYLEVEEILTRDINLTQSRKNILSYLLKHEEVIKKPTCREEILFTARQIVKETGKNEFSPQEIIDKLKAQNSEHLETTIRTHITSLMCSNAPKNHQVKYHDFLRTGRGKYSLKRVDF